MVTEDLDLGKTEWLCYATENQVTLDVRMKTTVTYI